MVVHRNVEYYIGETPSKNHAIHVETTKTPYCSHEFPDKSFLNVYTKVANSAEQICPVCESKTGNPKNAGLKIAFSIFCSRAYETIGQPEKRKGKSVSSEKSEKKVKTEEEDFPEAKEIVLIDLTEDEKEALKEFHHFKDLPQDVRYEVITHLKDPKDIINLITTDKELYNWFTTSAYGPMIFVYMVKSYLEIIFPRCRLLSSSYVGEYMKREDENEDEHHLFTKETREMGLQEMTQGYLQHKIVWQKEAKLERMNNFYRLMQNYNVVWSKKWKAAAAAEDQWRSVRSGIHKNLLFFFYQIDAVYHGVFHYRKYYLFAGFRFTVVKLPMSLKKPGENFNDDALSKLRNLLIEETNKLRKFDTFYGTIANIAIMSGNYRSIFNLILEWEPLMIEHMKKGDPNVPTFVPNPNYSEQNLYRNIGFPFMVKSEKSYVHMWLYFLVITYKDDDDWRKLAYHVFELTDLEYIPFFVFIEIMKKRENKDPFFVDLFKVVDREPLYAGDDKFGRLYFK